MGADSWILGIGRYAKAIATHLLYPPEFYEKVPEGIRVLASLFPCVGTYQSEQLAHAFGIQLSDFKGHDIGKITPSEEQLELLTELFNKDEVDKFKLLAESGFYFFFVPDM